MQPGGANVQPTTSPRGFFGGRARPEAGTVNHQKPQSYIDIDHTNTLKDDLTIVVSPAFGQAEEPQQDPTHVRFLLPHVLANSALQIEPDPAATRSPLRGLLARSYTA